MHALNPILPIIIANNGSHVHSEVGAIALVAGFAAVAIFAIVVAIRWSILDFIENRRPERKAALAAYDAIYAEKAAKREREWQAYRAEYIARHGK